MANMVEVLDSIMGSGKTTAILKWMKENCKERFIYISPLLSEIEERLVESVPELGFVTPSSELLTKSEDLINLLRDGRNIGTTHALFKMMTSEHIRLIEQWEYVVIVDEELEMIRPYSDYKPADFKWLYDKDALDVEEDHRLVWKDTEMPDGTRYHSIRVLCNIGLLYAAKRDCHMVTIQLPTNLITCAKRVIVLSYLFEGSVFDMFLKMKGIKTVRFSEVDHLLKTVSKDDLRRLITFVGDDQAAKVVKQERGNTYSSNWYKSSTSDLSAISKYIRNVCRSEGAKAEDVMWTVKSSFVDCSSNSKRSIKPNGYHQYKENGEVKSCWVGCSAKATNEYREKSMLVHCYNRYPHLTLIAFMQDCGYPLDERQFALAEMLQWVWRSRIRDGKPIKLAILSKRMREIFKDWLYND